MQSVLSWKRFRFSLSGPSPGFSLFCLSEVFFGCTSEDGVKAWHANPEASITSHQNGDTILEGVLEEFRAQVSDPNDPTIDLQAAWYAKEEIVCDWQTPDETGTSFGDITPQSVCSDCGVY